MANSLTIGAVIEDNYISAGLVNLDTRLAISETVRRKRINPSGTADDIISAWGNVLRDVINLNTTGVNQIGIGLPGPVDYSSGYFLSNDAGRYGSLHKRNIIDLLKSELSEFSPEIKLINDAASFFQGEVFAGAVRGYKKSFGITLGMGLGSARYVNGAVEDANLWSMSFKNKIAEEYLSVRWLINRFKELSGIEVLDLVEMKRFSPDARVDEVFAEFAQNLGEFLVEVIKKETPEVVLIGGHMESSNRFFFQKAADYVASQGIKTPIMKAILGEKAGIIGAGSVWYDDKQLHAQ